MTMLNNNEAPERQEIEALLPWHAAGTLSRRDAIRVEQALASDRELARHYDLVREELNETIHLNEMLGAPSARAMEKLFAAIDAEAPVDRKQRFDVAGRVAEWLSAFSPRTIAWAGAAGAIIVMAQAAVLTTVVVKEKGGLGHELASFPTNRGNIAVVRFAARANSSDITKFLEAHNAVVVDGPKKGGLYSIRLVSGKSSADVTKMVREMQAESKIVEFVAIKD